MKLFANQMVQPRKGREAVEDLSINQPAVVPAFLTDPLAVQAAHSSLFLYHSPLHFRGLDQLVADVTLGKTRRHMSYLKADTVVFCLSFESVSADEHNDVATTLLRRLDTHGSGTPGW